MMDIAIYQINTERDKANAAFVGLDELKGGGGAPEGEAPEIDAEIYDRVFKGEVDCENLEDVFQMFNTRLPEEYRGRTLSVSDIVEVREGGSSTFHFCDNYGFRKVEFEPELASEHKEAKIAVVLCEPGKIARIAEIGSELEDLQRAVGGDIEAFYPFDGEVCIVCNDEGKFNGMPLNRAVYGENGEMLDIIAGPFFVCDCSGPNFGSLNKEQRERFLREFRNPEHFFRIGGEIKALPYEPEKARER